ncbi:MAG: NPCBM/NEW2 domain-containing protein [Planctomycetes bacterium]|nr:NPCBM/NEW2 domain-containing protein [Planctomycetota bacterium]
MSRCGRRIRCGWIALALLVAAPGLAGQGLRGELRTVDDRALSGTLTVAAGGLATVSRDAGPVTVRLDEIVSFEPLDVSRVPLAMPDRVWLRSGTELPVRSLHGRAAADGRPAAFVAELPSGIVVDLPLGFVRAVRHGGSERPEPALFARDLTEPADNDDILFVQKDGQSHRSQVTITGLSPDRVEFVLRGTAYDFPLAAVTGIVFGRNTGFAPDRQPRPRTSVDLTTGERLEGRLLGLAGDLRLRLDEGAEVTVPLTSVFQLRVASDRLVWLSELSPKVEQTPAFDRVWPWGNDRCPAGPGLVIAGVTYERGVGMVPRTRLTYELGRRFDVFEASIGIDDRGGPAAHAIFRVLVDGRVAFESAPKVLGEAATPVSVELAHCQQLAIEVDFGKNYDLGDFCAFADARVVQR